MSQNGGYRWEDNALRKDLFWPCHAVIELVCNCPDLFRRIWLNPRLSGFVLQLGGSSGADLRLWRTDHFHQS